jgi:hypothetical protein
VSCEDGNEPFCSIKGGTFLDQLTCNILHHAVSRPIDCRNVSDCFPNLRLRSLFQFRMAEWIHFSSPNNLLICNGDRQCAESK